MAVTVAFQVLLPLRETPLPLERLAEIRGRANAVPGSPPVPASPAR